MRWFADPKVPLHAIVQLSTVYAESTMRALMSNTVRTGGALLAQRLLARDRELLDARPWLNVYTNAGN